jgi:hypothetical protein
VAPFDVNDFHLTLPGPLRVGCQAAGRELCCGGTDSGSPTKARRKIALAAAEGYRTAMRVFADQPLLEVW